MAESFRFCHPSFLQESGVIEHKLGGYFDAMCTSGVCSLLSDDLVLERRAAMLFGVASRPSLSRMLTFHYYFFSFRFSARVIQESSARQRKIPRLDVDRVQAFEMTNTQISSSCERINASVCLPCHLEGFLDRSRHSSPGHFYFGFAEHQLFFYW